MNIEFYFEQLEKELDDISAKEEGLHKFDPIQDWDELIEAKKEYLKNDRSLFESDVYENHLLLERFFKKEAVDKGKVYPSTQIFKKEYPPSIKESVLNHYQELLSKGLQYMYGDGQTDGFMFDDGAISCKFGLIESKEYYDLIGFYAYTGR